MNEADGVQPQLPAVGSRSADDANHWLSAVVASSQDAIIGFTLTGVVLSWNSGAEKLFEYRSDEMVGSSVARLSDGSRAEETAWILRQVRERQGIEGLNTIRLSKSGRVLQVAITAFPVIDGHGHVVGGAVSVRDVGEARRATEALRRSEERLRLVIENARDYAIFSTDLDRFITSWNRGAERLLGYTEHEALGRPADIIFTPEDRAAGAHQLEALTAIRESRAADERVHLRQDGSRFWASGTLMRMDDAAGNALGFVKILRDQTATRAAQAALERSQSDLMAALEENQAARISLEVADAAKDRYIAVLSHELRNPLASMLSAADLLLQPGTTRDEQKSGAAIIHRQALTMKALLDDLLDVSRLTVDRLHLSLEQVDLQEVIDSALESVAPIMQAFRHRLAVRRPSGRIDLIVDPVRIGQVIVNLLNNAAKYTPPSGSIALQIEIDASGLTITVSDDGIGMDPQDIERMFELYSQGPAHIHGVNQGLGVGLGLGLALVRKIVQLHEGSVRGTSSGTGKGSAFVVRLPLRQPTPLSPVVPASSKPAPSPMTILLADDNVDAAWALSRLLQREGHRTLLAAGGKEAFELAKTPGLHGAILDIGMPDLDGVEVARLIRATPWGERLWLVALTGWGGTENRRMLLQQGFDAHLIKPVDMAALNAVLHDLVERRDSS